METQNNEEQTAAKEVTDTSANNENAAAVPSHFDNIKKTLEILQATFPKVFVSADGEARPLKIGIFDDLKERISSVEGLSVSKVRAALRIYTTRLKYLYSVKEGAPRIDADGNECGDTVSAEHAKFAQEKIKEIQAKRKENAPKKPQTEAPKKNFKKTSSRTSPKPQAKKTFKIQGEKATAQTLKSGTNVIVISSEQSYVRGVVAQDAQKDTVYVTLKSGLTVNLPIERVLIDTKKK